MKRLTRIALSITSGVAAAAIALLYVSSVRAEVERAQEEARARYGGELASVCVASRDIEPGEVLDEGNVTVEEWVTSLLPAGASTQVAEVAGKTATSRIPKNAVVSPLYLMQDEGGVEVPAGKVAVSVASDEEHSVGGLVSAGDTVDVYVSKDAVADRLTEAQVLDTSTEATGGGQLSWVTLAVKPESVRELLAAVSRGSITLVIPGKAAEVQAEGQTGGRAAPQVGEQTEPQGDERTEGGES